MKCCGHIALSDLGVSPFEMMWGRTPGTKLVPSWMHMKVLTSGGSTCGEDVNGSLMWVTWSK